MLRFSVFERFGVVAAMSDRTDGDCSRPAPDPRDKERFLDGLGLPPRPLVLPKQVHGDRVALVRSGAGAVGEADGLATDTPGVTLGVTVADCVPVLLYCAEPRCTAAVHAGRAGTRQNIAARAVETLVAQFGASPAVVHAIVGPAAGPCCYEVPEEMAHDWAEAGLPLAGRNLDLWSTNRKQLEAAGVSAAHIHVSGICTICTDQFHSHRATGTPCRNLAIIHF